MAAGRAKKGGEQGVNGEYYAGGTFLPSTTRGKGTSTKAGKVKVRKAKTGPRWEDFEAVPEGMRAIYSMVVGVCGGYRDGKLFFNPHMDNDHDGFDTAGCQLVVDLYNAGEKFCTAEQYKAMHRAGWRPQG